MQNKKTLNFFFLIIAIILGWVALGMGVTYLFDRKSFRHWAIDAGYHAVAFTVMGGIIGVWH